MKNLPSIPTLAFTLTLTVLAVPAQAWQMNTSDQALSASSLAVLIPSVVVSFPLMLVLDPPATSEVFAMSEESSSTQQKSRPDADNKLPELEVTSVDNDKEGNPRVHLKVPTHPEQSITLTWPKSKHNLAAAFRKGSLISLKPSPQTSGWTLHDARGAALAFVPRPDNATEQQRVF